MSVLQMVLIALFIYLGAIGSIVGNTIGWYCLGRPLVASFVVGLIMGDVQTAMLVGVPLQIAYLANVTPGGALILARRQPSHSKAPSPQPLP